MSGKNQFDFKLYIPNLIIRKGKYNNKIYKKFFYKTSQNIIIIIRFINYFFITINNFNNQLNTKIKRELLNST